MPAEYDDRDDRDDRRDEEYDDRPPRRENVVEDAKAATRAPGIAFIVLGVITLLLVGYSVFQQVSGQMAADFAEQRKQFDANPGMPADQKKLTLDILDWYEKVVPFTTAAVGVVGLLTILGGRNMLRLRGRGLSYTVAILNFLPCVSGCCLIGLPFGIWAIVVLGRAEVKDGYAAVARGADDYDR